jgi:hypothetical protein
MTHPHERALEAAARAVYNADGPHVHHWDIQHPSRADEFRSLARAAVTAYLAALQETHALVPREATDSMTDAASDAAGDYFEIDGDRGPWLRSDGYKAAWSAMIDAAPPSTQDPRP